MLRCMHCEYCLYDKKRAQRYCSRNTLLNMFAWLIDLRDLRQKVNKFDKACEKVKVKPGYEKYR